MNQIFLLTRTNSANTLYKHMNIVRVIDLVIGLGPELDFIGYDFISFDFISFDFIECDFDKRSVDRTEPSFSDCDCDCNLANVISETNYKICVLEPDK